MTAPTALEEPEAEPAVLRSVADAETYVASVCFRHGPARLTGVELEWILRHRASPTAQVESAVLAAALGQHAPTSLVPSSPALPLPGGSTVTVEPGGQVELASPPLPGLASLVATTAADQRHLFALLAAHDLVPVEQAAEPLRPPHRILDLPRYRSMEQSFDRYGCAGRSAMCATAAVQVCVDAGPQPDIARRWAAAHALGPVLLAAFANSAVLHGKTTGAKSARWLSWMRADPARTAPPVTVDDPDPAGSWARRVLTTPVLCVRRPEHWLVPDRITFGEWITGALPQPPTLDDLRYHITTLFPPVRPHGHLEVRYVDAQPGRRWALPTAVLTALLADPATTDLALAACEPAAQRWTAAAERGLADPVLAAAAREVFALACARLAELDAPEWLVEAVVTMTDHHVARGLCPADLAVTDLDP